MQKQAVSLPRLVVVTRPSPIEQLRARHGTKSQAAFYLASRKQKIESFERATSRLEEGIAAVLAALPPDRRRARVNRDELDRFVFESDDIVFAVGQDGLVANVAKYLSGQRVIGVNPDPSAYDGVLCRVAPSRARAALEFVERGIGGFTIETRWLALAEREDGQRIRALNEVFIGHRSHQSARYTLTVGGQTERHSSSGVIVTTGTGATGWALSIGTQRKIEDYLPLPMSNQLAFLVREPFPSVATQTSLDFGVVGAGDRVEAISEMDDGVVFADGIESDTLEFVTGQRVTVRLDEIALSLVVPARSPGPADDRR